jgi:acetyl/propionyl-CoA carboxylase alpha subunit
MRDEAELLVEGKPTAPDPEWEFAWVDRAHREATLRRDGELVPVLVEGGPVEWNVTLRGRRIPVTVHGHRERLLAESSQLAAPRHGPAEVRATLPGLVVKVAVSPGDLVAEGDALLTVEAMKMENEIRAPRAGRLKDVAVKEGQAVESGALLFVLE